MRKPRIAMTAWRRDLPTFVSDKTDLYTLAVEYVDWIADAGGIPILLGHVQPEDAADALQGVDGLVLTGGSDMCPTSYGEQNEGASTGTDKDADESEIALALAALAADLPTLGICRGFQVVNVALGGTLTQDIADPAGVHRPYANTPREIMDERHDLRIQPGSRIAEIYGGTRPGVNTIHHQAVNRIANDLKATAWAPDDIVEALESTNGWDYFGVQWHPEKMPGREEEALFSNFLDSVRSTLS